jgi:hypothetical protein
MNWVHEHMQELRQYQGLWIAVVNQRVVAAGTSVMELLDEVGAQGLDSPFVTQIPDDVDAKTYFIG